MSTKTEIQTAACAPTRPLLRYHGGKWILAPWIISHFPKHRVYIEPFGGAASVLLRKPRSYAEIYNELDSEIVNLFRMVRDRGEELKRLLYLTPFAHKEYIESWQPTDNPIEQARRTVVRSFMGFGSASVTMTSKPGFRSDSNRSGTTPAHDWRNYPAALVQIIERLRGVVIENKEAMDVMAMHDGEETLHYVDPPYIPDVRDTGRDYRYEMTVADHKRLASFLCRLRGAVIVSGYPSLLYDNLFAGWDRVEKTAFADGAQKRTEVLWMRNVRRNKLLWEK